jgi:hypothetical protein
MAEHAHAQVRPVPAAPRPFHSQVVATSAGVAGADQAQLVGALESVTWERRGFLQTLLRRRRPHAAPRR